MSTDIVISFWFKAFSMLFLKLSRRVVVKWPTKARLGRVVEVDFSMQFSGWLDITFSYTLDKTGKIDIDWKSFTVTRLSISGIRQMRATFQLSGKNFLVNRGVYYVDNRQCNLVHHRFKTRHRNIVVAAGKIDS